MQFENNDFFLILMRDQNFTIWNSQVSTFLALRVTFTDLTCDEWNVIVNSHCIWVH